MSVFHRIILDVPGVTATDMLARLRLTANAKRRGYTRLAKLFHSLAGGFEPSILKLNVGAAKATATMTFTDDPAANGTFVLCGVTFTGKASGAATNEWNITSGGSAAADAAANAASVVTLVNANATCAASVIATSALGVVTFTALVPGAGANGLVLSESLTNCTAVTFAGGSDGTAYTVDLS